MNAPARIRYPSKSAITRAVEAARAVGLDVVGLEVSPDGSIRIVDARAAPSAPVNEFDRWESRL